MAPQRQLVVLVGIAALVIGAAWVVLLRDRVLIPFPRATPRATLSTFSQELDAQSAQFDAQLEAFQAQQPAGE